jgi:Transposase IS116/IS110/IS902 family
MPWPPHRPAGAGDSCVGQARPQGPGADDPARHRQADGDDAGRRDRDIGRFPTARKLCAWAGLTPHVRNSDRKVRHGHITKQGSPWVRGILQEAAQTAKRHPMFAGAYAQLARRRGKNIATVAIARRLLARSFHILIQLEDQTKPLEKASTGRARVCA